VRAAASRPGTELIWIEGSGHVLTADRRHEEVAALVAEWIERAS
jgi:esterase/lipase